MRDFRGGRNSEQNGNDRVHGNALDKLRFNPRSPDGSGELDPGAKSPGVRCGEAVNFCGAIRPFVGEMLVVVIDPYGAPAAGPVMYIPAGAITGSSDEAGRTIVGRKGITTQVKGKPRGFLNGQIGSRREIGRTVIEKIRCGNITLGWIERHRLSQPAQAESAR